LLFTGLIRREGFLYDVNPCGAFNDCRTCADAAGCGWCSDFQGCLPMAQDGFPQRTSNGIKIEYGEQEFSGYRQDPLCAPFGFIIRPEQCPVQKACMTRDGRGCGPR
jgi:hypothetical protein